MDPARAFETVFFRGTSHPVARPLILTVSALAASGGAQAAAHMVEFDMQDAFSLVTGNPATLSGDPAYWIFGFGPLAFGAAMYGMAFCRNLFPKGGVPYQRSFRRQLNKIAPAIFREPKRGALILDRGGLPVGYTTYRRH